MKPSRLLKTSTSGSASVLNLQMAPLGVLAPALEEDLESQARASLSLFGFGVHDAVNWSLVASGDVPSNINGNGAMNNSSSMASMGMGYSTANGNANGSGNSYTTSSSSSTSSSANGASGVTLLERVCPIGTNAFLWNTMNMGESGASGMSISNDPTGNSNGGDINSNGGNAMSMTGEDDPEWDPLGYGHIFASKILQQYLVKCVAVLPASVEEVVDLIIRSDKDDMETPMHHLVGVKLTASGVIYRRKRKRARRASKQHARRANNNSNNVSPATSSAAINSRRTGMTPPSSQPQLHHHQLQSQLQQQMAGDESESSSSDSEDEEDVVVLDDNTENQTLNELNRPPQSSSARPHLRSTESVSSHSISNERPTTGTASMSSSTSSLGSYSSYLDEYRASLTQGQQGNLSLKWVVGEKTGRMFTQKANYCLVDYECVLVNDWEDPHAPDAGRPMYVRALQSVYLPQCQPWIDELGAKPTDLQPTGIMVREATHRPGYVEVQFVASILEKAQLPMTSRRTKLRALCAKVAKLEEVITSRRLSQSLLAHTPLWVHNRERPVCHCCDAVFNLTRRRHHCRLCGEICCSDCCPKKDVALPEVGTTSVRVCLFCVQKRRHSGDALEGSASVSSSTLSPVGRTGSGGGSHPSSANSSYYNMATPPPPHHHPLLHSLSSSSSSSPSDYYLSSSSYSGSFSGNGNGGATGSSLGDRKPSLASSVFQKIKSNSLGN
ncbi:Zinc finger fyve domain-containing protein 9 [Globisporangium polare]